MRFAVVWKLISCFLTSVLPLRPYSLTGLTVTSLLNILKPAMRFLSSAHRPFRLTPGSPALSPFLLPPSSIACPALLTHTDATWVLCSAITFVRKGEQGRHFIFPIDQEWGQSAPEGSQHFSLPYWCQACDLSPFVLMAKYFVPIEKFFLIHTIFKWCTMLMVISRYWLFCHVVQYILVAYLTPSSCTTHSPPLECPPHPPDW